jgi:hypothetical protein
MVMAVRLLLLPFPVGHGCVLAAMLLRFVVSTAVLGALIFWVVFYGLAILLVVLVIGSLLVDRQTRHGTP